ncbi:MAG TPA: TadE/TadG family type IV pilus assembly protein [Silvibacterium sp.]|nr:TadE/TadG family type IV pilus assembly protein [Silvibacterium sp.]
MKRRFQFRGLKRGDAGQSLVEIALTMPLLVLLLAGGAEFACLAYSAIEVSNAAKAAVQYGGQNGATATDNSGAQSGMQNAINSEITTVPGLSAVTLNSVTTTLTCADGTVPADGNTGGPYSNTDCVTSGGATETLAVTTTATFTPWMLVNPLLKVCGIPTSFTLTGKATQVVLQ